MSKRDILRGLGAGLQSVGQGFGQIEQENERKKQQIFENNIATATEKRVKREVEAEIAMNNWRKTWAREELDFKIEEADRASANKDLDRSLQLQLQAGEATLREVMLKKKFKGDKKLQELAAGLQEQILDRKGKIELVMRARAAGMDMYAEENRSLLTFLHTVAPDEENEEAYQSWKSMYDMATTRQAELYRLTDVSGQTPFDESLPVASPFPEDAVIETPEDLSEEINAMGTEEFNAFVVSLQNSENPPTDAEISELRVDYNRSAFIKLPGTILRSINDMAGGVLDAITPGVSMRTGEKTPQQDTQTLPDSSAASGAGPTTRQQTPADDAAGPTPSGPAFPSDPNTPLVDSDGNSRFGTAEQAIATFNDIIDRALKSGKANLQEEELLDELGSLSYPDGTPLVPDKIRDRILKYDKLPKSV